MQLKSHFYFGNKIQAFQTGLGTILRALGHSREASVIICNDNSSWIRKIEQNLSNLDFDLFVLNTEEELVNKLTTMLKLQDNVLLISNLHMVLNENNFPEKLFHIIKKLKVNNELILTSEIMIDKFVDLADYVSSFSVIS